MENHLERKEVKDALATGYGYSVAFGTLGIQMACAANVVHRTANTYRLSACSTGLGEYILMLIPPLFELWNAFCIGNGGGTVSQSITRPLQEIPVKWWMMTTTRFSLKNARMRRINVIADTTRMSRNEEISGAH